jgi:hypothetical protein
VDGRGGVDADLLALLPLGAGASVPPDVDLSDPPDPADVAESPFEPASPFDPVSPFASPSEPEADEPPDFDPEEAGRRSFFAQPEPLKTMAGGAKVLRSVPSAPHSGQKVGTGALTDCRMSVWRPQFEHWYS